jgi:hypothetical protein
MKPRIDKIPGIMAQTPMRGSGGAYGFQTITDIGAALQQASESADIDLSRKSVGDMSSYLDRVEIISH